MSVAIETMSYLLDTLVEYDYVTGVDNVDAMQSLEDSIGDTYESLDIMEKYILNIHSGDEGVRIVLETQYNEAVSVELQNCFTGEWNKLEIDEYSQNQLKRIAVMMVNSDGTHDIINYE